MISVIFGQFLLGSPGFIILMDELNLYNFEVFVLLFVIPAPDAEVLCE